MNGPSRTRPARALFPVLVAAMLPVGVHALGQEGGFSVDPVRIFLEEGRTTEMVRIVNDSDVPLSLQVRAYRWTQDEDGIDAYEDTDDVVYFPRILTVDPGQERVVRVGLEIPVAEVEETYRIYLEELPDDAPPDAAAVQTLMRVGIPIFKSPESQTFGGALERVEWLDCRVRFRVLNRGNAHFVVQQAHLVATDSEGTVLHDEEQSGWYLLAGSGRGYELEVAPEACPRVTRVEIAVATDKGDLSEAEDVSP